METFIETPNLPHGRVKTLLIGVGYRRLAETLRSRGVRAIELPENTALSGALRSHTDMAAYFFGGGRLLLSRGVYPECTAVDFPEGIMLEQAANIQGPQYPADVNMNACELGKNIICNRRFTDAAILKYAEKCEKKIIDTRQGYARCSICILDEGHIITADRSIAAAAEKENIDVLLIEPGFFRLSGYEYGFIGGASFKLAEDTVAFTGSLEGHRDEKRIMDYIEKCGLRAVFLSDGPCVDIGSAIPVTEER